VPEAPLKEQAKESENPGIDGKDLLEGQEGESKL
jgi:hypothetical protein